MAAKKDTVLGTLTVAFFVCVVCGIIVATAAVTLRPVQQENMRLDKLANILRAAGLYEPGQDIDEAFKSIDRRFVDIRTGEYVDMPEDYDQRRASGDPAQSIRLSGSEDIANIRRQAKVAEVFHARNDDGDLNYIILPVHGYGLWSTMYGFLALRPDANTISGLGFYEHAETPGLGGEIDNARWQAQWEGKRLFDDDGNVAMRVARGSVSSDDPNYQHRVDGLSGATLTSDGVTNMLRFWAGENGFGPYLRRLQQGDISSTVEDNVEHAQRDAVIEGEV